jgi:hypothetical protein
MSSTGEHARAVAVLSNARRVTAHPARSAVRPRRVSPDANMER